MQAALQGAATVCFLNAHRPAIAMTLGIAAVILNVAVLLLAAAWFVRRYLHDPLEQKG